MKTPPTLFDDNGEEADYTIGEYLAQWGCDPAYDKAPRQRGDGYRFYNYDHERSSAKYLAELLGAIDRQLSDTERLHEIDRKNLTLIREYVADIVADADTSEQSAIVRGIARALFVLEWSDREDEQGRSYPGQALEHVAPPTPREATDAAHNLIGRFEQLNGMAIVCLLSQAGRADGIAEISDQYAENFGHYLAMEALGHGVGWFDDHKRFPLRFPRFEFSWEPETVEGGV